MAGCGPKEAGGQPSRKRQSCPPALENKHTQALRAALVSVRCKPPCPLAHAHCTQPHICVYARVHSQMWAHTPGVNDPVSSLCTPGTPSHMAALAPQVWAAGMLCAAHQLLLILDHRERAVPTSHTWWPWKCQRFVSGGSKLAPPASDGRPAQW